jgi:hypothetical protein
MDLICIGYIRKPLLLVRETDVHIFFKTLFQSQFLLDFHESLPTKEELNVAYAVIVFELNVIN